ncbi:hypothetical protein [Pseudalkalibacillus sp. SCS-8]|uniref:hypothetical protein n=1 Tax=Pseudalkalibacillus nanhaiensis TaxID=3115291 RepID=UPI0032D9F695
MTIGANLPSIIANIEKFTLDRNKDVFTEVKVLTEQELLDIAMQQMDSTQELEASMRYSLVGEESRHGLDRLRDAHVILVQNPDIESIKIELPMTRYIKDDKTIEFISGKGKILEVFENGEWKAYEDSQ